MRTEASYFKFQGAASLTEITWTCDNDLPRHGRTDAQDLAWKVSGSDWGGSEEA